MKIVFKDKDFKYPLPSKFRRLFPPEECEKAIPTDCAVEAEAVPPAPDTRDFLYTKISEIIDPPNLLSGAKVDEDIFTNEERAEDMLHRYNDAIQAPLQEKITQLETDLSVFLNGVKLD